ncbi:MAG: TfoX/Sxy family protein [Candidatus Wallbacteria bacterium]|nr:TfoX/Sxy family protein [Candidatus Wallbacteria bacterium]
MASGKDFVEFIVEQMESAGVITYKKMFGEYGIYCGGKLVAMVCDDRLFIKPTESGRAFIGEVTEGERYPGAKPYFLIEDRFEDREWISELIRLTAEELPEPAEKNNKTKVSRRRGNV